MLRIDKLEQKLVRLESTPLSADHWERRLQSMICKEPDPFCEEIGEDLWFIGQGVRPSNAVADRVDILAIDEDGGSVIVELKRGTHKLHLLQAISYAGMISRWPAERFVETLEQNYGPYPDGAQAVIEEHTGLDISNINHSQRILLIAEDFDPAVLIASEWLHESYGADIRCYRLQLSRESGNDYLTCTCIYPPIEIAALSRGSNRNLGLRKSRWADWDAALKDVENSSIRNFFRAELERKQEHRLNRRELVYRIDDKRRFYLAVRLRYAYVHQRGRFEDDEQYWSERLSEPQHIGTRDNGRVLRFRLVSDADFASFAQALRTDMITFAFSDVPDMDLSES